MHPTKADVRRNRMSFDSDINLALSNVLIYKGPWSFTEKKVWGWKFETKSTNQSNFASYTLKVANKLT